MNNKISKTSFVELDVYISGSGTEFNQGFISKKEYNKWNEAKKDLSQKHSMIQIGLWNEFCVDFLEKDGYWDISEVASFTGLSYDHASVEIYIDKKLFFSGSIVDLMKEYFNDDEIINSKNLSNEYGNSYLPLDWDEFFTNDSFSKREDVLVTTQTIENFAVSEKMDLKSSFDINKMGFIIVSTDEMGYGIDYGDYILGFTYGSSEIYFDFPGGVGQLDTPKFH